MKKEKTVTRIQDKKRFEVFKRDNFTCQYCGGRPPGVILTIDHILPLASGGTDDIENLITACELCNSGKGDVDLAFAAGESRTRTVHARLTPSLYEQLKEYASASDLSVNEVIFRAIEKEIAKGWNNGNKKNSKHGLLDRWKSR